MKVTIRIFLIGFLFVTPVISLVGITNKNDNDKLSKNPYSNLFVLGDSLSDTGAFVNYQGKQKVTYLMHEDAPKSCYNSSSPPLSSWDSKCVFRVIEWLPRVMDKPFYKYSFSNGPVAVELLAKRLGIKNFSPAWYDRKYKINREGDNYATGGAKVLSSDFLMSLLSEHAAIVKASALQSDRYSLVKQVAALKKHHPIIDSNALLIINIGSNDVFEIIEGIFKAVLPITKEILELRVIKIIEVLFKQIDELLDYGFNRIAVGNMPSLFLLPRFIEDFERREIAQKIVKDYNQKFNFQMIIRQLKDKSQGKLRVFNMEKILQDILVNYEKNGVITKKSAAAIDWTANYFLQSSYTPYFIGDANEQNIDNYAFFDDVHPSRKMNQDISDILFKLVSNW